MLSVCQENGSINRQTSPLSRGSGIRHGPTGSIHHQHRNGVFPPLSTITWPQTETPHFSDTTHVTPRRLYQGASLFSPHPVISTSPFPNPLRPPNRTSPRSRSLQAVDHVPFDGTIYSRISSTVADRPDLACFQNASRSCSHAESNAGLCNACSSLVNEVRGIRGGRGEFGENLQTLGRRSFVRENSSLIKGSIFI